VNKSNTWRPPTPPTKATNAPAPKERTPRFHQLLALANEGSTAAVADLFHEFEFRFGEDEP